MGYGQVPRIELNQDGTVTFFVIVGGFRVGTPVEISGYATQTNGAIATFQSVQLMPKSDPVEGVTLFVLGALLLGVATSLRLKIMRRAERETLSELSQHTNH